MAIICPACKHQNPGSPGACEKCGQALPPVAGDTLVLRQRKATLPVKKKAWQSADVGESRIIKVYAGKDVQDIHLASDEALTLGRENDSSDVTPDVDLMPESALTKGVSRVHARLRLHSDLVQVQDAGSTNGTFLNERRVSATEWRIVRHGDELRLGDLTLKIHFE